MLSACKVAETNAYATFEYLQIRQVFYLKQQWKRKGKMKKNNEKHHLKALLGVVVLYSLLGFAIYFTIIWQNPSFIETLRIVAMFCILILSFETFEQAVLSTVKWKKTLQLFLVIKELVTCFFISLISLLVAAKIMVVIVGDIPLTKNLFNLLISTTFITSLFLY